MEKVNQERNRTGTHHRGVVVDRSVDDTTERAMGSTVSSRVCRWPRRRNHGRQPGEEVWESGRGSKRIRPDRADRSETKREPYLVTISRRLGGVSSWASGPFFL